MIPLWTILGISVLFVLFPVQSIIDVCLKARIWTTDQLINTYEDKYGEFTTDYERENPITKKDALIREKKILLKKEKDPAKIRTLTKMITNIEKNFDYKAIGNEMNTYSEQVVTSN